VLYSDLLREGSELK
jgi:long-chain acyl-CoA synthetase